jgi:hypothetical protein
MPLPAPFEVQNECAKPPDMTGGHSVVICSEEQLKVCHSNHSQAALCHPVQFNVEVAVIIELFSSFAIWLTLSC